MLFNCAETYFDPDLFRQNTNQFLQTARTVTFIIQKNKASIPDFDQWYKEHVQDAWRSDPVMGWAKDARNVIEKEGDLELHSTLRAALIFSYLSEEDVIVRVGKEELFRAGIKKLIRLAQRDLPTGVTDAAVLRIERVWISAALSETELLGALITIYARIEQSCRELASHLESAFPADIKSAGDLESLSDAARRVTYVKVRDRSSGHVRNLRMKQHPGFVPPPEIRAATEALKGIVSRISSLESAVGYVEMMAEATFRAFSNHVPMLFLFDSHWNIASHISTEFADQAEKYIFWRRVAEQVATQNIAGLVWVGESWIRSMSPTPDQPIRKMPITGEALHVIGLDRKGALLQKTWNILRPPEAKPDLRVVDPGDSLFDNLPYYLVPAMRAMGIRDALERRPTTYVRPVLKDAG